jgi:hypothetical protein
MSVIVLICLADVGVRSRGIRSSASYGGWLRSAESTADLSRGGHTKARFRGSYATPAGKALPGKSHHASVRTDVLSARCLFIGFSCPGRSTGTSSTAGLQPNGSSQSRSSSASTAMHMLHSYRPRGLQLVGRPSPLMVLKYFSGLAPMVLHDRLLHPPVDGVAQMLIALEYTSGRS